MTYSLAKQLKDAGFPQKENDHTGQRWIDENTVYEHPTYDDVECLVPTLSELIEACGEGFSSLHVSRAPLGFKDVWFAHKSSEHPGCEGYSPEEAVAQLWLSLHDA